MIKHKKNNFDPRTTRPNYKMNMLGACLVAHSTMFTYIAERLEMIKAMLNEHEYEMARQVAIDLAIYTDSVFMPNIWPFKDYLCDLTGRRFFDDIESTETKGSQRVGKTQLSDRRINCRDESSNS